MPTIDLTEDALAAAVAAIRRVPRRGAVSARLGPLRATLAKNDPSSMPKPASPRASLPQAARTRGPGSRR